MWLKKNVLNISCLFLQYDSKNKRQQWSFNVWSRLVTLLWLADLRGEADGAALQTDLQAVGGAAAVLQYPTVQHCLTRLLRAGRLPCRFHAAAAAGGGVAAGGSAHSTRQTLPHGRAHG